MQCRFIEIRKPYSDFALHSEDVVSFLLFQGSKEASNIVLVALRILALFVQRFFSTKEVVGRIVLASEFCRKATSSLSNKSVRKVS